MSTLVLIAQIQPQLDQAQDKQRGQGGASAPVIAISGGGVRDLRNLIIQHGDPGVTAMGRKSKINGVRVD